MLAHIYLHSPLKGKMKAEITVYPVKINPGTFPSLLSSVTESGFLASAANVYISACFVWGRGRSSQWEWSNLNQQPMVGSSAHVIKPWWPRSPRVLLSWQKTWLRFHRGVFTCACCQCVGEPRSWWQSRGSVVWKVAVIGSFSRGRCVL